MTGDGEGGSSEDGGDGGGDDGGSGDGDESESRASTTATALAAYSNNCLLRTPPGPSRLDVLSWSAANGPGQPVRS